MEENLTLEQIDELIQKKNEELKQLYILKREHNKVDNPPYEGKFFKAEYVGGYVDYCYIVKVIDAYKNDIGGISVRMKCIAISPSVRDDVLFKGICFKETTHSAKDIEKNFITYTEWLNQFKDSLDIITNLVHIKE